MRTRLGTLIAGGAMVLAGSAPWAPAAAQDQTPAAPRTGPAEDALDTRQLGHALSQEDIPRALEEAEQALRREDCDAAEEILRQLHYRLFIDPVSPLYQSQVAEWRDRQSQLVRRYRQCVSGGTAAEAPSPQTAPLPPAPPNPDLDDLDAIVDDPNASLGPQGLAPEEPRQSAPPVRTDPGAETRPELTTDDQTRASRQQRAIDNADFHLRAAEAARRNGNCTGFDSQMRSARVALFDAQRFPLPPELVESWRKRIAELESAPCPPSDAASQTSFDPSVFTVYAGGLVGRTDLPQTGIGFVRDGPPAEASEEFALTTPDDASFFGLEGLLQFVTGRTPIRIGVRYAEGDASNVIDIPDGAFDATGIVNGDESPSGSAGIATPGFALSGASSVQAHSLVVRAEVGVVNIGSFVTNNARFDLSIFGEYSHHERDYTSSIGFSQDFFGAVFEANQVRQQDVSEDTFAAGLRGHLAVVLGNSVIAHLSAEAGGYHGAIDLSSLERNTGNVGPPDDHDFVVEIFDSNDGIGFRGEAGVALEFAISRNVSLVVGASADYRSRVGAIFNPNSGDQVSTCGLTTGLRTDDILALAARSGVLIRY